MFCVVWSCRQGLGVAVASVSPAVPAATVTTTSPEVPEVSTTALIAGGAAAGGAAAAMILVIIIVVRQTARSESFLILFCLPFYFVMLESAGIQNQ